MSTFSADTKGSFWAGEGGGTLIVYQMMSLDTALIGHLKSEKWKINHALFHFYQENNAYLNWCYTILY